MLTMLWCGLNSGEHLRVSHFLGDSTHHHHCLWAWPWWWIRHPRWLSGKEPACQCRRHRRGRFDPWAGKIPWRRHGNPLQYSCLENSMDRGAWRAIVHGIAKSWDMTEWLTYTHIPSLFPTSIKWKWSRSVVSDSFWPHGLYPTRLLCPWDSPGKNTGAGYHFLLQGIFPTQGSNPGLPHWRQTL